MKEHEEDRRLAATGPHEVTLYTRPGCHLCEEAKSAIAPLLSECGAVLREVNIEGDTVLEERYGLDIPVIFIGSRKAAKHRVNLEQFRHRLQEVTMTKGSKLLLMAVGFATLALVTIIAFLFLKLNSTQINLTDQQLRGILDRELPNGTDESRVKHFLEAKSWAHSETDSTILAIVRDASHAGLIRKDIQMQFLFNSEGKLVSYELKDLYTGP
ncbi:MAG TPA: glutaredoxin family protein [Candidatus Acidoferrum sp.]|nr:glutaredoxin family protein [Candidatus Acidoferrum sp.]